jgi:hypothetical protein
MGMMDRYLKYFYEKNVEELTLDRVQEVAKMKFLYHLGTCRDGRPLLYFRGSRFNAGLV